MDTNQKVKLTGTIIRCVELVLCLFLLSLIFFNKFDNDIGLIMNSHLEYLPLILSVTILSCFAVEFYVSRPWARLFYLVFSILVCLVMSETIYYLNMAIWLMNFFYLIILAFTFLLYRGKYPAIPQKNPNKFNKQLPKGMMSQNQVIYNYFWYTAALVLGLVYMLIWIKALEQDFLFGILIVLFLIIFFVAIVKEYSDPLKSMKRAYRKYNVTKFKEKYAEIMSLNLHPDTFNYVTAVEAKYYFSIDIEKGFELFEKTSRPEDKRYLKEYERIEILYHIKKKNKDQALFLIQEYEKKYPRDIKNIEEMCRYFKIYLTKDTIDNIKEIYSLKNTKDFEKLKRCQLLMKYYQTRGQIEESKKYAYILKDIGVEYATWFNEANLVLNDVDDDFQ